MEQPLNAKKRILLNRKKLLILGLCDFWIATCLKYSATVVFVGFHSPVGYYYFMRENKLPLLDQQSLEINSVIIVPVCLYAEFAFDGYNSFWLFSFTKKLAGIPYKIVVFIVHDTHFIFTRLK